MRTYFGFARMATSSATGPPSFRVRLELLRKENSPESDAASRGSWSPGMDDGLVDNDVEPVDLPSVYLKYESCLDVQRQQEKQVSMGSLRRQ